MRQWRTENGNALRHMGAVVFKNSADTKMGVFCLQFPSRRGNGRSLCTAGQKSYLEKTVTEALLADPYGRTKRVYDFTFVWQTDGVEVTFWVSGLWHEEKELTAFLMK